MRPLTRILPVAAIALLASIGCGKVVKGVAVEVTSEIVAESLKDQGLAEPIQKTGRIKAGEIQRFDIEPHNVEKRRITVEYKSLSGPVLSLYSRRGTPLKSTEFETIKKRCLTRYEAVSSGQFSIDLPTFVAAEIYVVADQDAEYSISLR